MTPTLAEAAWALLDAVSGWPHIEALRAALEAEAWQPIESAPMDGTHIILAFGEGGVSEGWWEDADPGPHPWKFIVSLSGFHP